MKWVTTYLKELLLYLRIVVISSLVGIGLRWGFTSFGPVVRINIEPCQTSTTSNIIKAKN